MSSRGFIIWCQVLSQVSHTGRRRFLQVLHGQHYVPSCRFKPNYVPSCRPSTSQVMQTRCLMLKMTQVEMQNLPLLNQHLAELELGVRCTATQGASVYICYTSRGHFRTRSSWRHYLTMLLDISASPRLTTATSSCRRSSLCRRNTHCTALHCTVTLYNKTTPTVQRHSLASLPMVFPCVCHISTGFLTCMFWYVLLSCITCLRECG